MLLEHLNIALGVGLNSVVNSLSFYSIAIISPEVIRDRERCFSAAAAEANQSKLGTFC